MWNNNSLIKKASLFFNDLYLRLYLLSNEYKSHEQVVASSKKVNTDIPV